MPDAGRAASEPTRDPRLHTGLAPTRAAHPLPAEVREAVERWRAAERFRQRARELYLEELGAVAEQLELLGARVGVELAFLRRGELRAAPALRERAAARRRAWEAAQRLRLPASFSLRALESPETAAGARGWQGVRVSGPAGDVYGVARVHAGGGAPALAPGEILVAEHVEPGSLPRLARGAGLLCEAGGLLSHAAILARELGLPAIMGAAGVTSAITDGDSLRLGADGAVEVLTARPWLPLAQAREPKVGTKALRLARASAHGLLVPTGAVLGHACFEAACASWDVPVPRFGGDPAVVPAGLRARALPEVVLAALAELQGSLPPGELIVRSSMYGEDDPGRSFAGQLRSVRCGGTAPELREAVCACWEAAFAGDLRRYGEPGRPIALSLIVQRYVVSDAGGVVFTCDPLSRDGADLLVEAAAGGAEPVVRGRPELRLRLPRSGPVVAAGPLLEREHLERLRAAALEIEQLFAAPQDIEWVRAGATLYIVQSRDIVRA